MFRRHYQRRSGNILYVTLRLCLSLVIFTFLLGGVYSAYKYFSGVDPLKIDPQTLVLSLVKDKSPTEFFALLRAVKLDKLVGTQPTKTLGTSTPTNTPPPKQTPVFSFVVVSDSHTENEYLRRSLNQAKAKYDLKFIIGLGDYTNVGTLEELKAAKQVFDSSGLRYFLAVGDHDLWDSRDKSMSADTNFLKVFGLTYQSFTFENYRFLILNNADNYLGMSREQLDWLDSQLAQAKREGNKAIYVFMHEPLYHPSSDHVMGLVNKDLKPQAKSLIHTLGDGGVKEFFFGHVHFFSRYVEPESSLKMTVVGALTTQNNAQAPRYAVVQVFGDGSLGVEDMEVK